MKVIQFFFLPQLCFGKGKGTSSSREYAGMYDRHGSILGLVIQTDKTGRPLLNSRVGYNCKALQCSITMYLWQAEQNSGFLQSFLLLMCFLVSKEPSSGDGLMVKALA